MAGNNNYQNKRLAKNTLILYLRTIVTLAISLYTSRVVLEVLGVDDYGVYNIIGGFVSLFAIVSQTMVASTQRYITFELGKIDDNHSREVYSTALIIHIGIALFLLLLFETIGFWFLNFKLNIAPERMLAANWLFQFSVFTFLLNIIRSPYEALIIAHERMSTFAYVNIMEATLKLLILFIILQSNIDRLIQYGFYLFLISLLVFTIYFIYCSKKFVEVKFRFIREIKYYKGMLSFAGYNFVGASSAIIADHGVNIMNLVYKGSKFSFLLYLIFGLPILIQAPFVLELWLGKVPSYAVVFVRCTLIISLLNTFANPLTICAFATGNIKKLSLWLGTVRLFVVPMVYVAFKLEASPVYAYIICFCTDSILLLIRLNIVCRLVGISKKTFVFQVLFRAFIVLVISFGTSILIDNIINIDHNVFKLVFELLLIMIVSVVTSVLLGLNMDERIFVYQMCKEKFCQIV